ncbi:MAG: (Protein-PII) uridylyltransferase [Frankiales bacterium]|nr:(Protein-PII) uridylyltransferase [Frankiales bacterium]
MAPGRTPARRGSIQGNLDSREWSDGTLKVERETLLARTDLVGGPLRAALTTLYDGWLASLLGDPGPGVALVAVGALGRQDPTPGSDLDLLLVHDGSHDVSALADKVWYPIWDSGVGLDHSVRTVDEAAAVARGDLKAALGLLDARYVAGDAALAQRLVSATRAAWRGGASKRLPELRDLVAQRAHGFGEVAYLLEPDLKEARGGLRDVHAMHAVAVAQVADVPGEAVRAAYDILLDVRAELHRRTGSAGRRVVDRLLMQEQDGVAAALHLSDADALMAAVSGAARTIAFASDTTWRQVAAASPKRRLLGLRGPAGPVRRPLADDVVEQDGEVLLARDATPEDDPVLVLRVAEAAARAGLPIAPITLVRLADCPALPDPWPTAALDAFVGLLAAGLGAVPVFEALDQAGLLVRLLPEWESVRSKPQRNSYHRFTVDRHLVEAAAGAAGMTRRVGRPDLLLLGALLHDIGKGQPGDHTEVGMRVVAQMAPRLGLAPADVEVLVAMVRHHLLLPDVATRRDLDDPATARGVADAVGSVEVLELLHALTEADSAATGPAAWSSWKGQLISELVRRTEGLLAGTPEAPPAPLTEQQEALVARGELALHADGETVTVVAPDRPGLLSTSAGVLALHRLDVRAASGFARGATAVTVFRVSPRFGALPDWTLVRDDLRHALDGSLPLEERLAAREAAYARRDTPVAPSTVRLVDGASDTATVVEVRAPDELGLLHRIASVLERYDLDVRSAHISTLGADVVDAFYVPVLTDPAVRTSLEQDLLAALP